MVIDTTIFIEFLRARDKSKTALDQLPDSVQYHFSSVTKFELFVGATDPQKWQDAQKVISNMVELPFENEVAIEAAHIYQDLQKRGQMIGFRDIFIAATARFHHLPIKTLNTKDFARIPGLQLV